MDSTNIVAKMAIRLAKELHASAIMISGNIQLENVFTEIPIYYASKRPRSIIDHLIFTGGEKKDQAKTISDQIIQDAAGKVEHVENAAAIEHMLGELKEGIVIGIVETKNSTAIVVNNLVESQLVKAIRECEERVLPEIMRAALIISFDIAASGREGKQIATAFIIGDMDEVMKRSHQMVLNPYAGHKDEDKDISNKLNWESIKEFTQLDGVFVVSEKGIINAAGRYLDIDAKDLNIQKGLGGRHLSAAAITRDTVAIAIVVSESGGIVRIYKDGKEMLRIEPIERAVQRRMPQ